MPTNKPFTEVVHISAYGFESLHTNEIEILRVGLSKGGLQSGEIESKPTFIVHIRNKKFGFMLP